MNIRAKSIFLIVVFLFLVSTAADAVTPVYVSPSKGNDMNACTLAKPCREFAKALTVVSYAGEVIVLDSGDFKPFSIKKSVSIVAPDGVYAGITSISSHGIIINAGRGDIVVIRGITIKGLGSGDFSGLAYYGGGILYVERCIVDGFDAGPGLNLFGSGEIFVTDTIVRNGHGIGINVLGSDTKASIDNTKLENNSFGMIVSNGATATVQRSVIAGSQEAGVFSVDDSSEVTLESCVVTGNYYGISVGGYTSGAIVRLSNLTVTENVEGLRQDGALGVIFSRGNNTVEGNGTDVVGTLTMYAPK